DLRHCRPRRTGRGSGATAAWLPGREAAGRSRAMIRGRVLGEVWATRKARGLGGRRLQLVGIAGQDRLLGVIDTLDALAGQEVLVSLGSAGGNVLEPGPHNRHLLADAAIALLVDGATGEGMP